MASYLPTTHYYIPRIEQREANLFMEEYYSNPDTTIYIDGTEQTEIGYISYSVQEQLKPLYGYASHTFDDMAVGNRIVTGAFKVPIRNPEAQTPFQDILDSLYNDSESNENYNDVQNPKEPEEWVGSNNVVTNENYIENDEIYEYVAKLELLGYDVDSNSTLQQIYNAIKAFQKKEKCSEQTGRLDDDTKNKIDEKLNESDLPKVKLKAGTPLFAGPAEGFDKKITLASECEVIVINIFTGWMHIKCEDGTEGYVKDEYVID